MQLLFEHPQLSSPLGSNWDERLVQYMEQIGPQAELQSKARSLAKGCLRRQFYMLGSILVAKLEMILLRRWMLV